ncbi:IS1634 family transposase [Nostoc punctiforme]|uniref:IS1634 family transposase n=1 Tax=Nostoc punctiforme TaxID=272131 RepID=UPI003CC8CF54
MFLKIASAMVKQWGMKIPCVHIDGTSLSVHGKYVKSEDVEENLSEVKQDYEEEFEPVPITITHGYSRDHRPDLKQFTLKLLTVGGEGIPLFMQLGNGNELDQKEKKKMIKEFQSQWQGEQPEVYIMDAAFYTEDNLSQCSQSIDWISRVPLTIKSAQELIQTVSPEQLNKSIVYKGYSFCAVCNEYAEIKQQWIVVESEERKI